MTSRLGILGLFFLIFINKTYSQALNNLGFAKSTGITIESIIISDSIPVFFHGNMPLISFNIGERKFNSSEADAGINGRKYFQLYNNSLQVSFTLDSASTALKGELVFENKGNDTIRLSNVLPFAGNDSSVYITGNGPSDLARACLFRPGFRPVRVILPDDAWEIGYSSLYMGNNISVCALTKREKNEGGESRRYETILPPRAKVYYSLHADIFKGEWQNGLRLMFRDKYLYSVENFNNSMYEREDLSWIKKSYLIILQMAWDRDFYDRFSGKFTFPDVIKKGIELFGRIDVYGIWPTWPRLGLDQRNQWESYRALPGGTNQLRSFIKMSRQTDTRFFIAYNPWDKNLTREEQLKGMSMLIGETEADGVVLDTRGSSSKEIQDAADSVRKGVVMYSEGMAVPADMQGIITGRVHNAIYLSPELNLNKLIKPDFSIFRVCDVGEAPIHRETAIAFFNGYGTELNMFRPGGRDDRYRDDLNFLSHTTFVLRQNNDAFLDNEWTPLIETTKDNIYVNKWESSYKTVYTVLNMKPEGFSGKLFKAVKSEGKHFVSIWNHENLEPMIDNNNSYIKANAAGWSTEFSGTRIEGSVDCIAEFPKLIKSDLKGDSLHLKSSEGKLIIWKGNPSYQTVHIDLTGVVDTCLSIKNIFGYYEGKIVLQLVENDLLRDEQVVLMKAGKPWLISKVVPTPVSTEIPKDMVLVPGTRFSFNVTGNDDIIPYPETDNTCNIDSFLIDKFPVTNAQFYEFLTGSGYHPADTSGFLRHWQNGTFRQGQDKYPVVNVSYEDITAYAKWAGKRLPTQAEWQLAAQGLDKRIWPWGNDFHGTFCNNSFNRPTPVDAFSKGLSPYGAIDMVGNVWQMTNDIYFNGSNYFTIIRGGSYYKTDPGSWYLQGGPQSLDKTQMLLMVSPGFDRSPTLGFRCVRDIDSRNFKAARTEN